MPQDSFRSIVFRSFVTCDDPGGIVECKTIRRSKTAKNAKSSKDSVEKLDSSSSAQLKEVSKEAKKLTKVVDSLCTNRIEKQTKDIAKDLLKRAESLEESLTMLGKLQYFKKKEKYGDRNSLERSFSERFSNDSNVVEFQKPRFSADGGSSRDCYDELREVIRESFARQKLLQKVSWKVDSDSSSQSSMFNSHDRMSSDSSSSNVQSEKPKGSNLIAKLMGLDEPTSKGSTNKRPILDLDLPIVRKPSFVVHKEKPDPRTLVEIIEIMQSKGLMQSETYEVSDDSPPIVLMKPLNNSRVCKEYPYKNKCTCGRRPPSANKIDPLINSTTQRKAIADKHAITKSFGEARVRRKDKQVIEKRVDKIHRVAPKTKKGEERKESNSGRDTVSKANQQGDISLRKSTAPNNQACSQKSTISRSRTTKTLPSSAKQRKPIKSDKKAPPTVENIGNGSIDIEIKPMLENEDNKMETNIISDNWPTDGTKVSSESTEIIIPMCDSSDNSQVNCISSKNESWKSQLLRNTTFLNHAEDLFHTTTGQYSPLDDHELPNAKLILACANELLECKCQQWESTVYPLLQHPKKRPKVLVSFEHLVGRMCNEIEKLEDNSRLRGDDVLIDYLYAKIKKDLWCNGSGAGAWDFGWMNAFSWDEVEQLVVDIEEELLGVIVEDLLSDFLLSN